MTFIGRHLGQGGLEHTLHRTLARGTDCAFALTHGRTAFGVYVSLHELLM